MWRIALWLLLAGVLAGRVAAMPGWMPGVGPHGIVMQLCNGGTMTMPMPGDHGMPMKHKAAGECPYAAAAHAGGFASDAAPVADLIEMPPLPPVARLKAIVPGRALALPPSTGPPFFD